MKRLTKNNLIIRALSCLFIPVVHAGTPVWTYSAPNPASVTVSSGGTKTVQYTVTNQSSKSKSLKLKATAGLSASSCHLAAKSSTCTLTLTVNGSQIPKQGIHSGPILCEQANPNQCYQPSAENQLNITISTPSPTPPIPPQPMQYTNIYAQTSFNRVAYSFNNGSTWNHLINQQNDNTKGSMAIDTQGVMYQAANMRDSPNGQVISSSDGIQWNITNVIFPASDTSDSVSATAVYGATLYLGTKSGYVVSTALPITTTSPSWNTALNQGNPVDNSEISALITDSTGTLYVGTGTGSVYYSTNQGSTWTTAASSPSPGNTITSLAITSASNQATWYASTSDSNTYYSTDQGQTWTQMNITWPPDDSVDTINVLSASNNVLYVGTQNGYVFTLTSSGASTWDATQQSASVDGRSITVLTVTQGTLSPLFVEGTLGTNVAPQALPVGGSANLTVMNYSPNVASNVQIQTLPTGVTQTPGAGCASVAPNGTCTITLSATQPFAPYNAAIVGSNSTNPIERIALVSSMNDYLVYNVNTNTHIAYVVDTANAQSGLWSPSTSNLDISEISTSPPCNGATDGYCNTGVLLQQSSSAIYAAGSCAAKNTSPSFPGGTFTPNWWYLPSVCESGAGLVRNSNGNSILSCSSVSTGIFSLFGLGYLADIGSASAFFYWSSTQVAFSSSVTGWQQNFLLGGGGSQYEHYFPFFGSGSVRCVQGLTY